MSPPPEDGRDVSVQHKGVNCPEANTLSHLGRTKKRGGNDIIHLTVASKELDTNTSPWLNIQNKNYQEG